MVFDVACSRAAVGDAVAEDEQVAEIETDKVRRSTREYLIEQTRAANSNSYILKLKSSCFLVFSCLSHVLMSRVQM